MKTGRTALATAVMVGSLVAGTLSTPAAGRHVATVTGGRDSQALTSHAQIATVTGGRDMQTAFRGAQIATVTGARDTAALRRTSPLA